MSGLPTWYKFRRNTAIAAALTACSIPVAAQTSNGAPSIVAAFEEVCLADGATAETLPQGAINAGFRPQAVRVISTSSGTRLGEDALPRFYRKGILTLSITKPGTSSEAHLCVISGAIQGKLPTQALAHLISVQLQSGEPSIVQDGRGERVIWQLNAWRQVEAEVRRESSIHSVKLVARSQRRQLARLD